METKSKERLYRILPFDRAVDLIKGNLYFSHPSVWDDPFEKFVDHEGAHAMFAQCWCMNGISDAMWRIYSPNNLSVRVRTTRTKLREATDGVGKLGYKRRIKDVEYIPTDELRNRAREIANILTQGFNPSKAADLLFWKRNAFQHEDEVRALIYCENAPKDTVQRGQTIKIDGHRLVESVLLDPRIPEHFGEAMKLYLKSEIGFSGTVQKSELYGEPEIINARIPENDL